MVESQKSTEITFSINNVHNLHSRVAVIIINFRNSTDTIDCIQSLIQKEKSIAGSLHVIIVNIDSAEFLFKQFQDYHVKISLINLENNLGFAGANNIGILHAIRDNADYIFLLNNDIVQNLLYYLF